MLLNHESYDLEIIWRALDLLKSPDERAQLMREFDAFMTNKSAREVAEARANSASSRYGGTIERTPKVYNYLNNPMIVNLVKGDSYLHALDEMEEAFDRQDSDEHKIITTLLGMNEEDLNMFRAYGKQVNSADPRYARSKAVYDKVTFKMDLDERWMIEYSGP